MTSERTRSAAWPGLVAAVLATAAMTIASIIAWPDMAETIVTREAGGNHGASVVSRGVTAIVPPIALLVVAAVLAFAPALDQRLRSLAKLPAEVNARGGVRVLNYLLAGLSIFFVVFHLGLLSLHTGAGFPFETAVPAAAGLVLVFLGVALPLARPDDTFGAATLERARRAVAPAYRIAGFALVILGLLTIATAFLWPAAAAAAGAFSVVIAAVAGGVGAARVRRQPRAAGRR
jgi:hypothetical protein